MRASKRIQPLRTLSWARQISRNPPSEAGNNVTRKVLVSKLCQRNQRRLKALVSAERDQHQEITRKKISSDRDPGVTSRLETGSWIRSQSKRSGSSPKRNQRRVKLVSFSIGMILSCVPLFWPHMPNWSTTPMSSFQPLLPKSSMNLTKWPSNWSLNQKNSVQSIS